MLSSKSISPLSKYCAMTVPVLRRSTTAGRGVEAVVAWGAARRSVQKLTSAIRSLGLGVSRFVWATLQPTLAFSRRLQHVRDSENIRRAARVQPQEDVVVHPRRVFIVLFVAVAERVKERGRVHIVARAEVGRLVLGGSGRSSPRIDV